MSLKALKIRSLAKSIPPYSMTSSSCYYKLSPSESLLILFIIDFFLCSKLFNLSNIVFSLLKLFLISLDNNLFFSFFSFYITNYFFGNSTFTVPSNII